MPSTGDIVRASDFEAIKPQLSIGSVSTGAAGSNASASITGTSPNFKLNLTIPRGANGTNGTNGTSGIMFSQVFTSSTTVTVPTGATNAILSGCGGGGGGYQTVGGGGGGSIMNYVVSVSAGQSIRITIGTGGAAATNTYPYKGGSGGITSFGSLLSLGGGGGGNGGVGDGGGGAAGSSPTHINNYLSTSGRSGGTNVTLGGETPWGNGGSYTSAPSGYGSGGAGQNSTTRKGRPGILIVIWSR